jgi:hypothetical protein
MEKTRNTGGNQMPAESKDQMTAARIALGAKRGRVNAKDLQGASKSMYDSMSMEQLEHYAHPPKKKNISKQKGNPGGHGTRERGHSSGWF